ncbi:hypothetical protein Tco_0529496 [Tanacetum coccineum]
MEECHKLLTDQVDDAILRYNVSKPLPLGGEPGHVTIQPDFFFNKDLEYLRYGRKVGRPALSISKMKAAYYPDVGLEQLVPDQFWIAEECKYDIAAMYGISHWWFQRQRFYIDRFSSEGDRRAVRTHMRILSVVRIEVFSMYGYNYMKKIVLRRADLKEYVIAERDFKHMYPSDFEDLYLLKSSKSLEPPITRRQKILTTACQPMNQKLGYSTSCIRPFIGNRELPNTAILTNIDGKPTVFEFKHDYTVLDLQWALHFRDKYGDEHQILVAERCGQEQGLHIRYPETAKDTTYLSKSGELCGWKDPRRRLPVAEENRMRAIVVITWSVLTDPKDRGWRWRHLVPVESIHHPMLTLNVFNALIIKDWVSDSKEEDVPQAKIEKKTVKPSFAKIEFVKPKGKTAKQVKQLRQNTHTPRGNQRN